MLSMPHCLRLACLLAIMVPALLAADATAQPLATLRWQLQPYCNVVTINVAAHGSIFTLDGFDDQCGASVRASVVGTAFLNPDGSIGMGLSTVIAPGGAVVHVDARIDFQALSGTWRDSAGNQGRFVLTPGAGTGGSARPVAPNGLAAGSVTTDQLAAGSVTSQQIAAGTVSRAHLVSGAVGAAQIDPGQVQVRITGSCPAGQAITGIGADGSIACAAIGLAGYEVVPGPSTQVLPGAYSVTASAACPPGKRAIGGGQITSLYDLVNTDSYPTNSNRTWTTWMRNIGTTAQHFTPYAICAFVQ